MRSPSDSAKSTPRRLEVRPRAQGLRAPAPVTGSRRTAARVGAPPPGPDRGPRAPRCRGPHRGIANDVDRTGDGKRGDGCSARHRLDQHQPEGVGTARKHEQVAHGPWRGGIRGRAHSGGGSARRSGPLLRDRREGPADCRPGSFRLRALRDVDPRVRSRSRAGVRPLAPRAAPGPALRSGPPRANARFRRATRRALR